MDARRTRTFGLPKPCLDHPAAEGLLGEAKTLGTQMLHCLQELRWLYDRRDLAEAQRDLAAWLTKWSTKDPKLTNGVEDKIGETLTFDRLPQAHHKPLKSANMLECLNEEIKRRTRVVRIFPNTESCLRLVRALCVEIPEAWLEDNRYLNMDLLKEQCRERLRAAA